jgi:hypothetical protein
MMVQNYNFSVKPQCKNQPFSIFFLKTADFCLYFVLLTFLFYAYFEVVPVCQNAPNPLQRPEAEPLGGTGLLRKTKTR